MTGRELIRDATVLKAKAEKVTLGSLDVQGYASPVNYWVPLMAGRLHDAPWRTDFGGDIYLTNGFPRLCQYTGRKYGYGVCKCEEDEVVVGD